MDAQGATDSGTTSVTVTNTAPQISTISITPDPGHNDNTFTCSAAATDADGDSFSLTYQWTDSAGSVLSSSSTFNAATSSLYPGDSLSCTAVATDTNGSQGTGSSSTIISNRAPNSPYVYITWNSLNSNPVQGDQLNCNVSPSSQYDPDGTPVSTSYSWLSTANIGTQTNPGLNGVYVMASEIYSCNVTLSDGSLTSQGFDSVQAVYSSGHEIQSNGTALVVTNTCGQTACDESLELPDASLLDFVEVSAGIDPLGQYELTQDVLFATTELSQGVIEALVGLEIADFGRPMMALEPLG